MFFLNSAKLSWKKKKSRSNTAAKQKRRKAEKQMLKVETNGGVEATNCHGNFAGSGEFVQEVPWHSRGRELNLNDPGSRKERTIRTRDTSQVEGSVPFLIFSSCLEPCGCYGPLESSWWKIHRCCFSGLCICYQLMQFVDLW